MTRHSNLRCCACHRSEPSIQVPCCTVIGHGLIISPQGFCGVRFNPYLWNEGGAGMKDETGLALYKRAGELNMPVGVMCFKGLRLHLDDMKTLLEASPRTKVTPLALQSIPTVEAGA